MPAQSIRPEDKRISPISIKVAQTTGNGAADGSTLVDSGMIGAVGTDALYAVISPGDPVRAVARQISGNPDGAGAMTLTSVFPAQVLGGVEYAIVNLGVGAGAAGLNAVAVADAVANLTMNQAVGNKTDAAQQVVALTRSLMAYTKALKTNQGDPSGHTLISWALKWGNHPQSFLAWAGDMSAHALTSIAAKWGNMTETLLVVLGARADAAVETTVDASMHARLKGLQTGLGATEGATTLHNKLTAARAALLDQITAVRLAELDAANLPADIGNPSGDTLVSLTAKLGNMAVSMATKTEPVRVAASFSYLDAGGEQTVFTIAPAAGQTWEVSFFSLDINTLTQNNTIRTKKRIDGTTFRTIASVLALSSDEGVFDSGAFIVDNTSQLQVTMQEAADEAAARAIPYEYYYRRLQ